MLILQPTFSTCKAVNYHNMLL